MIKENCDSRAFSRPFLGSNIKHSLVSWVLRKFSLKMASAQAMQANKIPLFQKMPPKSLQMLPMSRIDPGQILIFCKCFATYTYSSFPEIFKGCIEEELEKEKKRENWFRNIISKRSSKHFDIT